METISRGEASLVAAPRLVAGRYEMQQELLRCRFSTLFSCVDTETWTPLVLRKLNLVEPPVAQSDARAQFSREGHLLRRLAHRNLPRVLDCVEEGGEFFILMEPFEGYTLDYVVQQLSGAPQEVLLRRWMEQVAAALEYLHVQTPPIVYRDLRPQTTLLTQHAVIKLVDFGLARLVLDRDPRQTIFRGLGTQHFAAPEQLQGSPSQPAVDLYALGAMFHTLATATPPPAAADRLSRGVPLPSARELNPGLSEPFAALLGRLMELVPAARPRSAGEVRAELRRLAGLGAAPPPAETRIIRSVAPPPYLQAPPPARAEQPTPPAVPPPQAAAAPARKPIFSFKLPWLARGQASPPSAVGEEPPPDDLTRCPHLDLATLELRREAAQLIPEAIARRIQGVCVGSPVGDQITLAVKDPTQVYIYDHVAYATHGRYKPLLVRADAALIDLAHEYVYQVPPRLQDVGWLAWLEKKRFHGTEVSLLQSDEEALLQGEEVRGPAIETVDRLIKEAVSIHASDIHLETYEAEVVLRYRIDGMLHVMDTWPRREAAAYIKRVKIMANMDIAQDLVPQGGRISLRVGDREFDLRVSCVPVPEGESIVMRVLDKGTFSLRLSDLGFSERNLLTYRDLVNQPHGMMLVSGPTGSGKSTTLYATLAEINRPDRKILTVEDPIEYRMPGVVQVQVNMAPREEEKRLTFARALREFLRQDPDVILVGEIRDNETAAVSVQAALTGHLVLSTIHTNDALGIITRLRERGVEPFLVSSTLRGGVAQRLVRTICEGCKTEVPIPDAVAVMFERERVAEPRLFKGQGCVKCHRTGYRGRVALYEVLAVDAEMSDLIAHDAPQVELSRCAEGLGMRSLLQDGLHKVAEGRISIEEVQRVCMAD